MNPVPDTDRAIETLYKDGTPYRVGRQRVMLVLRRDAAGRWRFARGFSQPGPDA